MGEAFVSVVVVFDDDPFRVTRYWVKLELEHALGGRAHGSNGGQFGSMYSRSGSGKETSGDQGFGEHRNHGTLWQCFNDIVDELEKCILYLNNTKHLNV